MAAASASSSSPSSSHQQPPLLRFDSQSNTTKTIVSPKVYDAFINHRGPDVKHTLALLLYKYIQDRNCRAFLDSQEFEAGDSIPSTIRDAICSSSVQIAIFTEGYADSVWCLDELVLMLQQTKARFIPVFYGVKPWQLRYNIEKGVYADAFTKLEKKGRHSALLISEWKRALDSASKISGYDFDNYNHNHEELCKELEKKEEIVNVGDNPIKGICPCTKKLCHDIVTTVVKEVERTKPLRVAKSPVGLDVLVQDFETWVSKDRKEKADIIGIFGMGGIGKTTLSKELFNRRRSEYSAACFLFDVREASTKCELPSLQTKLLKDLFGEDRQFQHIDEGYSHLSNRLGSCDPEKSFLIVIDDIDNEDQLNSLFARDRLTCGSLVLGTTRDERVLKRAKITCRYKLKEMDSDNSTNLFCQHAFGTSGPAIGYEDLVKSFVKACGGLPLSLQILGSHVFGGDLDYWERELTKVLNTLPKEIKHKLRISIDALDNEEKQVFMDIACFFISEEEDMAMTIWKGSGWINAEHALETLKDRCLVTVKEGYLLGMHDHVRDLGREIADAEISPSRLWHPCKHLKSLEGKNFQNILGETSGKTLRCLHSCARDHSVYAINSVNIRYFLGNSNDCAETKTSLLWLRLENYGSTERTTIIPSWIPLQNLQCLIISGGNFHKLWQSDRMVPLQLKKLKLSPWRLEEFSSFSSLRTLSDLEDLELTIGKHYCIEGGSFLETLRKLTKLKSLVLRNLTVNGELAFHKSRDAESPMVSLHKIKIVNVKLEKFSVSAEHCPSLKSLILQDLDELVEVDLSPSCCELKLRNCKKLKKIPKLPDLQALFQLKKLKLSYCSLQEFPLTLLRMLNQLEKLELEGDRFTSISIEGGTFSDSVRKLTKLRSLVLRTLKCNGELSFYKSRDAESPMVSLHKIEILRVSRLKKVSVSAEHCPSLQSLILQDLPDLDEVDLSPSCYQKLTDLAKWGCSEQEQFLCLKRIQIIVCLKLNCITGIEKLESLNFLFVDAVNGSILNCIQRLQRVPTDHMTVMGRAVDGAVSKLNANLFSNLIGLHVFEFDERISPDWQPQPQPLSAVFVCVVVEKPFVGKHIVTTILPYEKEIGSGWKWPGRLFNDMDHLPLDNYYARVTKGCIVSVNKKEEQEAVDILKRIIEQLYQVRQ